MGDVVDLKSGLPVTDAVVMSEPNNPKKMLEANGLFQYDAENKRIVSPQGAYLAGPQLVEMLNVMSTHGQLLFDIDNAIQVVLFGRTDDTAPVEEMVEDDPSAG